LENGWVENKRLSREAIEGIRKAREADEFKDWEKIKG